MTMKMLLERPEMYARCAEDKEFCRKVMEESLRHSAIATPYREVAADFTYQGFSFRKGETVVLRRSARRSRSSGLRRSADLRSRSRERRPPRRLRSRRAYLPRPVHRHEPASGRPAPDRAAPAAIRALNGEIVWRPFLGAWGLKSLPIVFDVAPAGRG